MQVTKVPVKLYLLLSQPEDAVDLAHIGFYVVKNTGTTIPNVLLDLYRSSAVQEADPS